MFRSSFSFYGVARLTAKTDRRKVIQRFHLPSTNNNKMINNLAIIGCDETGTGCLAGPLVASAFCVLPGNDFETDEWIRDSKAITRNARQRILNELLVNSADTTTSNDDGKNLSCVSAIEVAPVELIDAIENITTIRLNYLSLAVRSVVEKVKTLRKNNNNNSSSGPLHFCVIVDGKEMPADIPLDFPMCAAIPQADDKYMCVAAASIIAKMSRDKQMEEEYELKYPNWGFAAHKGYGTADHVEKVKANFAEKLPLLLAAKEQKKGEEEILPEITSEIVSSCLTPIHRRVFVTHFASAAKKK